MVRISRINDRWVATGVRLSGLGNANATAIERHERVLTDDESRQMLLSVNAFGLWNRRDASFPPLVIVFDGVLMVVEGRRGMTYHSAFLVNVDDAANRFFRSFMPLAGMKRIEMDP
jgi:hypothetical protein